MYTMLTGHRSIVFINQLVTFHAFRTANYAVIKCVDNFQSDTESLMNEKGFKITLKSYLNTLILLLMNTYCPENYVSI